MDTINKCDHEIYEHGHAVGIIGGGNAEIIELIVKRIASDSGQPVDWNYVGGRAVVKTTGDFERVRFHFRMAEIHFLAL